MKLQVRFLQLPVMFDAEKLAHEVSDFEAGAWRPHPLGYEGNDYLPLIAVNGNPQDESFHGPMRPTPHLSGRPYLEQVLASLGAVLGRTRLMRLSGHAEVVEHVDVNYYWRDRMRVHVPIITQPTVTFYCGDEHVHMGAGECWIFDTWRLHRVVNDESRARIHLVADTVGGEGLLRLIERGRAPNSAAPGWAAHRYVPSAFQPTLELENFNVPKVMTPWEVQEHLTFLLSEVAPGQPAIGDVERAVAQFTHQWRALWSAFGDGDAGRPRYRSLLDSFVAKLRAARADELMLVNEVDFFECCKSLVVGMALSRQLARPPQAAAS